MKSFTIGLLAILSSTVMAPSFALSVPPVGNQCYDDCMKHISPLTPPEVAAAECRQQCGMAQPSAFLL